MYSSTSLVHKLIYKINPQNKLSIRYSNYIKDISKYALNLGVSLDEQYEDRVQIILLATGVGGHSLETQ